MLAQGIDDQWIAGIPTHVRGGIGFGGSDKMTRNSATVSHVQGARVTHFCARVAGGGEF
jgi:hypothetical protein